MKTLISKIPPKGNHLIKIFLEGFISNFLTAWLLVGTLSVVTASGNILTPAFLHSTKLLFLLLPIAAIVLVMTAVNYFRGQAIAGAYALPYAVMLFGVSVNTFTDGSVTNKLYIAMVIFMAISIYYSYRCGCYSAAQFGKKQTIVGIAACFTVFAGLLIAISALRYFTYSAPNFDFGIFVNMYHNMKESFAPVTTCERDKLLSHFAVHVSPIYYVLLPIYYIFPSPYTLQISQALLIYSGVIPLCLLMNKLGIGNKAKLLLSLIFLCYPALACGCFYDFHENCFLVPLLLWVFYFFECNRTVLLFVFAALTCAVKEDAAVYIAVFACYAILSRRKFKYGFSMLAIAVVIFVADCIYLSVSGEGIMSDRFANLIYQDEGLLGVFKTIIANPGYFLSVLLSTKDDNSDKLIYIMNILVPLAMLPFLSKKISRYILIAPIFINLMSNYYYQYNIGFQYHFGISAFLFYIILLNIADVDKAPQSQRKLNTALMFAVLASLLLYSVRVMPMYFNTVNKAILNYEEYNEMDDILDTIPEDASVTCSTFLLPHLADREVIYEVHYHDMSSVLTEYLVLDMRPAYAEGSRVFEENYIKAGYKLIAEYANKISVYQYTVPTGTD